MDSPPFPMESSSSSSSSSSSPSSSEAVVMAALLRLPPGAFGDLAAALSADLRLRRRRLAFLLLHPLLFLATLDRLRSLSLSEKTHLLARLLLRSLHLLLRPFSSSAPSCSSPSPSTSTSTHRLRLRDFDAALLLLAMCDAYDPASATGPRSPEWHARVASHVAAGALSNSGLGSGRWSAIGYYVDSAAKCRRLLEAAAPGGEKAGREAAASVAAVVALPLVECRRGGRECVICKEEMEAGRDVCEMPCRHRFHWGCVVGWLRERNTCPCCRLELPTEDVWCEIGRAWRALLRIGDSGGGGGGGRT